MTTRPEVLIFPTEDAVVGAVAQQLAETLTAAQRARGSASVVLTGGGTGIAVLASLRQAPGNLDWSALDIYFGDERFVPANDPDRNELQAREALLDHVDIDPARVFAIAPSDGEYGDNPVAAAAAYAAVLADNATGSIVPEFDVHLLGMGAEGHVNSLFPDTDAVREELASVVAVTNSPKPPSVRVTLTLPAVRHARQVWLVTTGSAKAQAVAAAVAGAPPIEIPSSGARGSEVTRWFIDDGAAALLPETYRIP